VPSNLLLSMSAKERSLQPCIIKVPHAYVNFVWILHANFERFNLAPLGMIRRVIARKSGTIFRHNQNF